MLSFAYQETVGGAVFLLGLILAWRAGEVGPRGRGAWRLGVLVGGFLLLAACQGALQWLATR